jgi:excisionase family DNA binding protein
MDKQPSDLMTPAEVAEVFSVDPKTVTRWATTGRLPSLRTLGGHRRFRRSDIERLSKFDDETTTPPEESA